MKPDELPGFGDYVDFHAHIAPGVDHGSADLAHSLCQLEAAERAGVGVIAATSHFYLSDGITPREFADRRDEAICVLRAAYSGSIKIIPGAEVHLGAGLSALDGIDRLCVGDTGALLIEMPYGEWAPWTYDELNTLCNTLRFGVIIAHFDRYTRHNVDSLVRLGLPLQLNASAAASFFGYRRAKSYIAAGYVTALGSDVHDEPEKNYRDYAAAIKKIHAQGFDFYRRLPVKPSTAESGMAR